MWNQQKVLQILFTIGYGMMIKELDHLINYKKFKINNSIFIKNNESEQIIFLFFVCNFFNFIYFLF